MRTVPGDGGEPYKETKHTAGGVSDGIMFDLSTYPAIEKGFILGETDRDATSIKFPFKMAGGTIEFKAVTKEEYQEQTEAFKSRLKKRKIDDDKPDGSFLMMSLLILRYIYTASYVISN